MVWRYFVPLSILVLDEGLVRGPLCFHSGTPYRFQKNVPILVNTVPLLKGTW